MKYIMSTSEATDMLLKDENAGWSYEAARTLVEWFEQREEEAGEEMELDVCEIRCEWSQWDSASEAAESWGYVADEGAEEEEALLWLDKRTIVLQFSSGVVVNDF